MEPAIIESVIAQGDLAKLTPAARTAYYQAVCRSLGLNPLTRPFEYLTLNGKLTLYARRDATDQLRARDRISVQITGRERMDDVYVVTACAKTPSGRSDEAIGAVAIGGLKGDALANALMKAETKAKRRATLSLVGLGWLDETEIDTVPGATPVPEEPAMVIEAPKPAAPEPAKTTPRVAGFDNWPPAGRKRFWARAREMDLTDTIVHAGFGVDSMKEFDGTMDEAAVVLEGLGYAIETTIGVAGLVEALGMSAVEAASSGWTAQDVRDCIDRYIAERTGGEQRV